MNLVNHAADIIGWYGQPIGIWGWWTDNSVFDLEVWSGTTNLGRFGDYFLDTMPSEPLSAWPPIAGKLYDFLLSADPELNTGSSLSFDLKPQSQQQASSTMTSNDLLIMDGAGNLFTCARPPVSGFGAKCFSFEDNRYDNNQLGIIMNDTSHDAAFELIGNQDYMTPRLWTVKFFTNTGDEVVAPSSINSIYFSGPTHFSMMGASLPVGIGDPVATEARIYDPDGVLKVTSALPINMYMRANAAGDGIHTIVMSSYRPITNADLVNNPLPTSAVILGHESVSISNFSAAISDGTDPNYPDLFEQLVIKFDVNDSDYLYDSDNPCRIKLIHPTVDDSPYGPQIVGWMYHLSL